MTRSMACSVSAKTWRSTVSESARHTRRMTFTVVFRDGNPRDYGAFDSYEVSDAGVLLIQMQREDVSRHYIAPGGWLEVVEMAEGHPVKGSRGILAIRSTNNVI
jgi:hypothetical protein